MNRLRRGQTEVPKAPTESLRSVLPLVPQAFLTLLDSMHPGEAESVLSPDGACNGLRRLVELATTSAPDDLTRRARLAMAFLAVQTLDVALIEGIVRGDEPLFGGGDCAADPEFALQRAVGAHLLGRSGESFRLLMQAARSTDGAVAEAAIATELGRLLRRSGDASVPSYSDAWDLVAYVDAVAGRHVPHSHPYGEVRPLRSRLEETAGSAHTLAIRALVEGRVEDARTAYAVASKALATLGYRLCAAQLEMDVAAALSLPAPNLRLALRLVPSSWLFAVRGRALPRHGVPVERLDDFDRLRHGLGAAERRVLDLICSDLSTREIAVEVSRSPSTIKNQTIRIFRAFGVADRSALREMHRRSIRK